MLVSAASGPLRRWGQNIVLVSWKKIGSLTRKKKSRKTDGRRVKNKKCAPKVYYSPPGVVSWKNGREMMFWHWSFFGFWRKLPRFLVESKAVEKDPCCCQPCSCIKWRRVACCHSSPNLFDLVLHLAKKYRESIGKEKINQYCRKRGEKWTEGRWQKPDGYAMYRRHHLRVTCEV